MSKHDDNGGGGLAALLASSALSALPSLPSLPSLPPSIWTVVEGALDLLPASVRPPREQFFSCKSLSSLELDTNIANASAVPSRQQGPSHALSMSVMKEGLKAAAVVDGAGAWRAKLLAPAAGALSLGGVLSAAAGALSPQGPGCSDFNRRERVANVASSLPYALIGLHAVRRRRSTAGRAWGGAMFGVCAASAAFHASSGRFRELGRRVDYWTIAAASGLLTRALYPGLHPALTAASFAATPFAPFAVTTTNALALEGAFLARALANPELRGAQRLHSAACVAGVAVFAAEEASVPKGVPLVHATWHLCSALSTALVNCCLADVELQAERGLLGLGGSGVMTTPPTAGWGSSGRQQQQQQQWRRQQELCVTPLSLADDAFQRGGSGSSSGSSSSSSGCQQQQQQRGRQRGGGGGSNAPPPPPALRRPVRPPPVRLAGAAAQRAHGGHERLLSPSSPSLLLAVVPEG